MRHLPILSLILFPTLSHAADFDGASLSLFWGAPFALILLSIALGPLFLRILGITISARLPRFGRCCF